MEGRGGGGWEGGRDGRGKEGEGEGGGRGDITLRCITHTHHANERCLSITDKHDPGDTRLATHEITGGSPSHNLLVVRVV